MRPRDPARLRIGDAERNAVADSLARHFADGRIDETELKERLDGVMAAKTGEDLVGFLDDLPPLEDDPSAEHMTAAARVGDPATPSDHACHRPHRSRLVLLALLAVVILASAHALWWGAWLPFPPLGWLLALVIVFGVFRRKRRYTSLRAGSSRCTCGLKD